MGLKHLGVAAIQQKKPGKQKINLISKNLFAYCIGTMNLYCVLALNILLMFMLIFLSTFSFLLGSLIVRMQRFIYFHDFVKGKSIQKIITLWLNTTNKL